MKDYKKILEGVVNIINTTEKSDIGFANICNYIGENCPELAESKDERIRKEMIEILKKEAHDFPSSVIAEKSNSWISWLEKQGEQNTVVIIPKFKIGDTIRPKGSLAEYTIESISGECYHGKGWGLHIGGDDDYELVEQKPTEIVKWSPQEESCICQLESLVKEQWRQAEKVHNSVNIKKMSELMFFLKTLNPNKKPQSMVSAEAKEAMYDKPVWSEEDIRNIDDIDSVLFYDKDLPEDTCVRLRNWLKSLKDRVQPQPMQEWSCGDEAHLHSLITHLEQWIERHPNTTGADIQGENIAWLKSLRFRNTWKPSEEQMEVLNTISSKEILSGYERGMLIGLYTELQKLKA